MFFVYHMSGLGEEEGWGGGATFIRNESISLPNNHFELQKDKNFPDFCKVIQVCMKFVVGEMTAERHL